MVKVGVNSPQGKKVDSALLMHTTLPDDCERQKRGTEEGDNRLDTKKHALHT